jgi:hypothetical protein
MTMHNDREMTDDEWQNVISRANKKVFTYHEWYQQVGWIYNTPNYNEAVMYQKEDPDLYIYSTIQKYDEALKEECLFIEENMDLEKKDVEMFIFTEHKINIEHITIARIYKKIDGLTVVLHSPKLYK